MKKPLYYTLMVIFCAVFIVCAGLLIRYAVRSQQTGNYYDALASRFHNFSSSSTAFIPPTYPYASSASTAPTVPPAVSQPSTLPPATLPPLPAPPTSFPEDSDTMLENMAWLYSQNEHTVGWISIPSAGHLDTGYPVVQSPNTTQWQNYYLDHDFDGNKNGYGCVYAQEACDIFGPSDNVILYGHNMVDGKMFGFLNNYYLQPQKTYETHKYIQFDTLYGRHTYEIFAVFNTSGTLGVGFPYHTFTSAANQAEFDEFIAAIMDMSLIEGDLWPIYGNQILCLSTCGGKIANGRIVVAAVRIA